jgi:hypothetical protein
MSKRYIRNWLIDIFNRLFPPPPLKPNPIELKKQRDYKRNHRNINARHKRDAMFGKDYYLTKSDIDELRESLRDYDF